jgi:hypothetical protein
MHTWNLSKVLIPSKLWHKGFGRNLGCTKWGVTHYRDLPLVNDHQSDPDIRDDTCAFYEVLLVIEP